jgi:hypothetical protein
MSCSLCQAPITDDDRVAEAPCCDQVVHSQCLINNIAHSVSHYHNAICSCGGILYLFEHEFYNTPDTVGADMDELIKQPAAAAAYKKFKSCLKEKSRCMAKFISKLREANASFMEQVTTNIDLIKNIKKDIIDNLKQSEEYKKYNKSIRSLTYYTTLFKRQFNLNDNDMRKITPRIHGRWYSQPLRLIRRKFRLRILDS